MKRAVIVAGAGRSGTSTAAGSLAMLGLHVPQPEVPADDTNPRGFYESQWVVDFHKELLNRDPVVRTLDARPEALELAQESLGPDDVARATTWLEGQFAEHDQLVLKDPRIFWFHDLWRDALAAHDARCGYVTMLRHPAEVAKSRDTHYTPTNRGESFRRQRATANIAGWCNAVILTERITRSEQRTFVRYPDLLANWRTALAPVALHLDVEFNTDLAAGEPHAVDEFIEPSLRRSETTWDSVDVPDTLREIADATWAAMNALVTDPADAAASSELDELAVRYGRVHDHAVGVALDHTTMREAHVRRRAKANQEQRIADLEAELKTAHEALNTRRGIFRRG